MIQFDVKAYKAMFFDRAAVMNAVDQAARKALSKFGSFVRTTASRSIRKARMKTLAEMTPEERKRYKIRLAIAKRKGLPLPKRPLASSKPGEPPRSITGVLKNLLFFGYEPSRQSVVIGPAISSRSGGEAPPLLEYGGTANRRNRTVTYKKRPFMQPAFEKERPKLSRMFRDQLAK